MSYQAKQYHQAHYQAKQHQQAPYQAHYQAKQYQERYQAQQYQERYQVPEKNDYYYDDSPNPIEEICKYTDNLEKIQPEIRYRMLSDICRNKSISVYGDYTAPPSKQIVDQINGQGGYFLKMTAKEAGIYLIWYYQAKGRYLFWGPTKRSVRDAMNRIRGRIVKYVVHLDRHHSEDQYDTYEIDTYEIDTYEIDREEKMAYVEEPYAEEPYAEEPCAYAEDSEDEDEEEYIAPVPPTFDEQFGKVSQEQMNKMGFISGKGLGSKHTGRIDPINPIKDIGGRMYNRRYGLGYTKPVPVPAELVPAELVPAEPVPAELVPAELVHEPAVPVPAEPVPNKVVYSQAILEIFSLILNHEDKCQERASEYAWN